MRCFGIDLRSGNGTAGRPPSPSGAGPQAGAAVVLQPEYYRWWGCSCDAGFTAKYTYNDTGVGGAVVTGMQCLPNVRLSCARTCRPPPWACCHRQKAEV